MTCDHNIFLNAPHIASSDLYTCIYDDIIEPYPSSLSNLML